MTICQLIMFISLVHPSVYTWASTVEEQIEDTGSPSNVDEVLAVISVESQGDHSSHRKGSPYYGLTQVYGGALEYASRHDEELRRAYCHKGACVAKKITASHAIRAYLVTQRAFARRTGGDHRRRALLWKRGPGRTALPARGRSAVYLGRYEARLAEIQLTRYRARTLATLRSIASSMLELAHIKIVDTWESAEAVLSASSMTWGALPSHSRQVADTISTADDMDNAT